MIVRKFRKVILTIILALVTILFICILGNYSFSSLDKNENIFNNASISYTPNTQEYVVDKVTGKKNTIYWAQGVNAPKRLSDGEEKIPGERYFEENYTKSPEGDYEGAGDEFLNYQYFVEEGMGYYDFNKNPARINLYPQQVDHQCYLAAAMNLLYWWFEQNSTYIDQYVYQIKQGTYQQHSKLHPITDEAMWERYRTLPVVEDVLDRNYRSMEMSTNAIYKEVFDVYQKRDKGYFSDLPWDYFINGYAPLIQNEDLNGYSHQNNTSIWTPSSKGGFFYPVFGKEKLSNRRNVNYENLNQILKDNLNNGVGVELSYKTVGNIGHAVTLWGAEYDDKGNLVTVYITDSDDYDITNKINGKQELRGLISYKVLNKNGIAYLTNNETSDERNLSPIYSICELDLAQDKWVAKLNDLGAPIVPKFEGDLPDQAYNTTDTDIRTINVNVKREDTGVYEYQWYVANDSISEGEKILNATQSWYTPPKPIKGQDKYYYCMVTNNKNGKQSISQTRHIKVYIDDNITNAAKPVNVKYAVDFLRQDYNQYEQPKPIVVMANSPDGGVLSYQWYHKIGMDNTPTGGELLEGETSNVFYPNNLADYEKDGDVFITHQYYCIVTNTRNDVKGVPIAMAAPPSNVNVTILNEAPFTQALKPAIIHQPVNEAQLDIYGNVENLVVKAKSLDHGNLEYQWYKAKGLNDEGVIIQGATKSIYQPENLSGVNYYYCKVVNRNDNAKIKTGEIYSNRTMVIGEGELSSDNELKTLTYTNGTLSPSFMSNHTTYVLTLDKDEPSTILNGTVCSYATVTGFGVVNLEKGESKKVVIVVTAQNSYVKEYEILVSRQSDSYIPSNNAYLLNIITSQGTLTPVFKKDVFEYTINLDHNIDKITLSVNLEDDKAKCTGTGEIVIEKGETKVVNIVVIAEDKTTTNTYKVTINREFYKEPVVPDSEIEDSENENPSLDNNIKVEKMPTWSIVLIVLGSISLVTVIVIVIVVKKK